eukprot:gene10682-biopygen19827
MDFVTDSQGVPDDVRGLPGGYVPSHTLVEEQHHTIAGAMMCDFGFLQLSYNHITHLAVIGVGGRHGVARTALRTTANAVQQQHLMVLIARSRARAPGGTGQWRGRGAGMARAWRGLQAMFGLGWRGRGAGMARAWRGHVLFPLRDPQSKSPSALAWAVLGTALALWSPQTPGPGQGPPKSSSWEVWPL